MSDSYRRPTEFDQYAPTYLELLEDPARTRFTGSALHFHRRKRLMIRALLQRAGVDPGTLRWLDVGCGRGDLLGLMGAEFKEAVGCDPSTGMLPADTSLQMHEQTSAMELPFAAASFDFVTAVCVFHHVHGPDRLRLCSELKRILKPGGLVCVIEHNPRNPVTKRIVSRCAVDVDAELLTARTTRELLTAAGFEYSGADYFLYLPEQVFKWLGWAEQLFREVPLGGQYAAVARAPHEL